MDYQAAKRLIKNYNRNKRFVKRIDGEILLINTKYFGARSSSVLGNPGGLNNESMHTLVTIGQDKLDDLEKIHGNRYRQAAEDLLLADHMISRMPPDIEEMIIHCYVKCEYVDEMAEKYRCSRATIYNRINAAIKEDCELLE